jgi:hypothetical protein
VISRLVPTLSLNAIGTIVENVTASPCGSSQLVWIEWRMILLMLLFKTPCLDEVAPAG